MLIRHNVGFAICSCGDGSFRIRVRLSMPRQGRAQWWISTKVGEADVWDKDASLFRKGTSSADKANEEIRGLVAAIEEVFGRYELIEKRVPTLDEVKRDVDEAIGVASVGEDMRLTAAEVYDMYIEAQSLTCTRTTVARLNAIKAHIVEFDSALKMCDVNDAKMQEYYEFLVNSCKMKNSTTQKQIVFMRAFLRWSANNGYYSGNSHETFRPRIKGANVKEIIYCTREELKRLMEFTPPPTKQYLERVRDVFVFCCFTGLRYSDVAKLRRCDVYGDEYISVVTQKTSDPLRIELNTHSVAILRKYADPTAPPTSKALPVISNVKMNDYLKELGKEAGLCAMTRVVYFQGVERHEEFKPKYELLTTHCARRTFVVTALQLGIPPEVIMRWTGHSSYEAMKPYVAIVDELKRRSMNKFDLF